jgi:phosphatidylserine/phosphatidylglycerophosphate/cardiolipin synthase-like enzyme
MAKFLTTRGTSSHIEEIINQAKDRVVLISPYVKISGSLFPYLKDAARKKVKITLVYGKKELEPEVRSQLEQLDNLSLHFCKELHAKCYYNAEQMVISSMNLYDFSEVNNEEMGILLSAKDDKVAFDEARTKAESIINSAAVVKLRSSLLEKAGKEFEKGMKLVVDSLTEQEPPGHCIGCGRDMIPYNKDHPICGDCWKSGVRLGRFCYKCGEERRTTQKRPLCSSCYR